MYICTLSMLGLELFDWLIVCKSIILFYENNDISKISVNDKQIVLNHHKKLSSNKNRENYYLKGLVIPVEIKRKKLLNNKKSKS